MALLGSSALAMWWDIAPARRQEFEHWHTHEHFRERLGLPGFLRGSRWACADGGEGLFVMYELLSHETLTSPAYVERLNNPTPWSTAMMPHHRNMVRSQCRVLDTHGGGLAAFLLTMRFSPNAGAGDTTRRDLQEVLRVAPDRIGLTSGHLLVTETPRLAPTAEQKIRGGRDAVADWIVLVSGYDQRALQDLAADQLSRSSLGLDDLQHGVYRLSYAATGRDLEPTP